MQWTTSSSSAISISVAISMVSSVLGWAQPSPGRVRVTCDPADPRSRCPGVECACLEDSIEVTFDDDSQSVLDLAPFEPGRSFESSVVLVAKSAPIQGWSYGVAHDERYLRLEAVTVDGTDAAVALQGGFVVATMTEVERCVSPPPRCDEVAPGGGYIAGVILSFREPIALELGRRPVCRASYATVADPGLPGTLISIVHRRLKRVGSPPVDINITVGGRSRSPGQVVDGWVGPHGDPVFEDCANGFDDDGDGALDCDDLDCEPDARCQLPLEHCATGLDEDGDALVDCADPDCAGWPSCQPPEICSNGSDDDRDGATDCDDPQCAGHFSCRPPSENCANGVDDDGNGRTDCQDPACSATPACLPPETCDNGTDDDRDGLTDCDDPACFVDLACPPRPEACRNHRDDDRDGAVDCEDDDCADTEECQPRPEICSNAWDDDQDGFTDCADRDCEDDPGCGFGNGPPEGFPGRRHEVCDNCRDDDLDGKADSADPECAARPAGSPDCAGHALYFGRVATAEEHSIRGSTFVIALRNAEPATGFRLGVKRTAGGDGVRYRFAGNLGGAAGQTVGLSVSLAGGGEVRPRRRNKARGPLEEEILSVERGPALCGWEGSDFLSIDLAPRHGGPGFTVEYVAPSTDGLAANTIAATSDSGPCRVHELLRVRLGTRLVPFRRGDADGSGRLSIADALKILLVVLGQAEPRFDCASVLDANDDGRVDIADGVALLQFVFGKGPDLPAPFPGCGLDPTPDGRPGGCSRSNCP